MVSSDSLEHFHTPEQALREATRVLTTGGTLAIWVPFIHPFHASDYYRYTPLGLRHLLDVVGLRCDSIEAPLGLFTIYAQSVVVMLQKIGLGRLEQPVEWVGNRLDQLAPSWSGYAAFYHHRSASDRAGHQPDASR